MSQVNALRDQVARLFSEKLNLHVPDVDTDLLEQGILDSLTFVGLLHEIELQFQIRFSIHDLDIERFRSIRSIAESLLASHNLVNDREG